MKKIVLLTLFSLLAAFSAQAQHYLHFYMNDSTYNGFYTEDISKIYHDSRSTKIRIGSKTITLDRSTIDSVVVEDQEITDQPFKGNYHIYEIDADYEKDGFSKLCIDNRAHMMLSKKGDFGANDTILLVSEYHKYRVLITTNEYAEVSKVFDGKRLLYFDYAGNCIEILKNSYKKISSAPVTTTLNAPPLAPKSVGSNIIKFLLENKAMHTLYENGFHEALQLPLAWNQIQNNPNNHHQLILKDLAMIGLDIAGVCMAMGVTGVTGGTMAGILIIEAGFLVKDVIELMNDLRPDSQQLEIMKDYYQDYYGIKPLAIGAEDVKVNSARLKGSLSTIDKIKGDVFFELHEYGNTDVKELPGEIEIGDYNFHEVYANADNLKWNTSYSFYTLYKCVVDGLKFTYKSPSAARFRTPTPAAATGEAQNIEKNSAEVRATFTNIPDGASCGIEYGIGNDVTQIGCSAPDGEEVSVNLSGLKACTLYSYKAFVKVDGKTFYGSTKTFVTDVPDITGAWKCTVYTSDGHGGEKTHSYTLTLKKDGSVEHSEIKGTVTNDGVGPLQGNWSLRAGGKVSIAVARQFINSGAYYSSIDESWFGKLDNLENPTKITGTTSTTTSSGNGWHEHGPHKMIMVR